MAHVSLVTDHSLDVWLLSSHINSFFIGPLCLYVVLSSYCIMTRHGAAADMLLLIACTSGFTAPTAYAPVQGLPVHVQARELGNKVSTFILLSLRFSR